MSPFPSSLRTLGEMDLERLAHDLRDIARKLESQGISGVKQRSAAAEIRLRLGDTAAQAQAFAFGPREVTA